MKGKYCNAALLFFIFLIIYDWGSFSKIPFGDSIEYALNTEVAVYLDHVTPLSHFLYSNSAIFLKNLFNWDSVFVCKMMSVVPGAASVSLVYLFIREFVKADWAAISATIVFGFSFTFWRSSGNLEVYTFYAVWVVIFFLFIAKSFTQKKSIYIVLVGLMLGLSLYAHIQSIVLVPAYIFFLYQFRRKFNAVFLSLSVFAVMVFGIISINFSVGVLPQYAVLTNRGPWVENTFKQSPYDLVVGFGKSLFYLVYNFNIFLIPGFMGIGYFYKNFKTAFAVFFISGFFTYAFASFYPVSDNYVYFIPFYFLFSLLVAVGLSYSYWYIRFRKYAFICLLIPLFYYGVFQTALKIPQAKAFHEKKEYKGGLRYYLLPWLNDNVGCVEFVIEGRKADDSVEAMKEQANRFIQLRSNYQPLSEIKKL